MPRAPKRYLCDPRKNTMCRKDMCFMYGGPCEHTTDKLFEMEMTPMNKLAEMLDTQAKFQLRLDPDFYAMSVKDRVAFIKEHSIHLNQEVNEMLYELPFFKPWKNYDGMTAEQIDAAFDKARMECVDAWHFFMNIMLALGFDADSFYTMYMAKNRENHRRQDVGYSAMMSYRNQEVAEVLFDEQD